MSRCPSCNDDGRPCIRTRNHNGLHSTGVITSNDWRDGLISRWGSWSRVDEETNGIGTKRAQRMARKRRRGWA